MYTHSCIHSNSLTNLWIAGKCRTFSRHTAYNIQHTVYSIQHTVYSIQHTAYNIQHTAYSIHSQVNRWRVKRREEASVFGEENGRIAWQSHRKWSLYLLTQVTVWHDATLQRASVNFATVSCCPRATYRISTENVLTYKSEIKNKKIQKWKSFCSLSSTLSFPEV
jgi:hypothetical protein